MSREYNLLPAEFYNDDEPSSYRSSRGSRSRGKITKALTNANKIKFAESFDSLRFEKNEFEEFWEIKREYHNGKLVIKSN